MPVAELTSLRTRQAKLAAQTFTDRVDVTAQAGVRSELLELELSLRTSGAKRVELVFSNAQGQNTTFRVDKVSRRYEVDRSGSGMVDFNPVFSRLQSAPLREPANDIAIHAYVDRSSIELFINGGETTFTVINFPASPYTQISLKSDGKTAIVGGSLYELKSIWDQQ
jgi:sucrose-6-phosphate hydrolase SacC (GH32 family)